MYADGHFFPPLRFLIKFIPPAYDVIREDKLVILYWQLLASCHSAGWPCRELKSCFAHIEMLLQHIEHKKLFTHKQHESQHSEIWMEYLNPPCYIAYLRVKIKTLSRLMLVEPAKFSSQSHLHLSRYGCQKNHWVVCPCFIVVIFSLKYFGLFSLYIYISCTP